MSVYTDIPKVGYSLYPRGRHCFMVDEEKIIIEKLNDEKVI